MRTEQVERASERPRAYSAPGLLARGRARDLVVRASLFDLPPRERAQETLRRQREGVRAGHAAAVIGAAASKRSSSGTPLTILTGGTVAGWYRADLGVTGTSTCTALADQSTGGHNLVLATNGPTINASDGTFVNRQTFTFTGSSCQLYTSGGFALAYPATFYLIAKPTTWVSAANLVGSTSGGSMCTAYAGGSPNIYQLSGTYANGGASTLNSWHRIRAKFTNSSSDSLRVGSVTGSISAGNSGSAAFTSLSLASFGAAQYVFNELVVCPWVTSGTEDTNMDAYFVSRFSSLLV